MNQIETFEHVQRYLEWREIQDKLTKRLKNYKFPNELQRPSFDSEESDDEMDMFFKMDEDLEPQPVPVKKEEVLFVSSNAWDALAAKWFGFDVFWVNRFGHPFEEIGERPNYEGSSLSKVLEVI